MRKLWQTLAGTTFALALTVGAATNGAAQETPAPIPDPQVEEPQVPVSEPAQEQQNPIVVELGAVGGAEGSGAATLQAGLGDQAEAVIEVEGLEPGTQWSAFLIEGTCEQPGNVVAPLGTVDVADAGSGRGEVSLTSSLADIAGAEATVQLHPQGETPTQAVLCGAIPAAGAAF